jgi:hypothetical protein
MKKKSNMESVLTTTQELPIEKIRTRTAKAGVIGLGYVGLPLAVEFANAGFSVTGIDVQHSKVDELNAGCSYIQDVSMAWPSDPHTLRAHLEPRVIPSARPGFGVETLTARGFYITY